MRKLYSFEVKFDSTGKKSFGDLSQLSENMLIRLIIFLFCLLGASMIWYPFPVEIGYTTMVRSGLPNTSVELDFKRLSVLQGCRFIELMNNAKSSPEAKRTCFLKKCLIEAGKQADVDYVLGGSIDRINTELLISWRLMEVVSGEYKQIKVMVVPYDANTLENQVHETLIAFIRSWQQEKHESSLMSRTKTLLSKAVINATNGKTSNRISTGFEVEYSHLRAITCLITQPGVAKIYNRKRVASCS